MTNFTDDQDELLIHLVKKYPCLYVIKSKSYKNINTKNKAWSNISQAINKNELDCRTRWKSIRDYYRRKKRAFIKGRATAADRNYFFKKFNHLSFIDSDFFAKKEFHNAIEELQNTVEQQVEDVSTVDHEAIENYTSAPKEIKFEYFPLLDDAEESTVEDEETANVVEAVRVGMNELQDEISNSESEPSELQTKRRSTESLCSNSKILKVEEESSENTTYEVPDGPLNLFFKSIYATVSAFSPAYQAKAKMGIMQAVGSIEIEAAQNDQCKLTPTTSTTIAAAGTPIFCLQQLMKQREYSS